MAVNFETPGDRCGWPEAVLFDLDGTLIDSAPDIQAAVNELLALENLPPQPLEAVRRMIGNGVVKLVERAFAAAGHSVLGSALDKRVEVMMGIYARHLVNLTIVLPGAVDVVSALAKARVKVAVVSNKPHPLTVEILGHYGFAPHLAAIQGADKALKTKPAPDMLLAALNVMGVKPSRALFVGDSATDSGAAAAAGMPVIIVRSGYGHDADTNFHADAFCTSLHDIPSAIEKLKEPA